MKGKRVLVVGSGAREHALAWKLAQSPDLAELFIAPGNAGTSQVGRNVPIAAEDVAGMARFVEEQDLHLTVVGPEAPLALGLTDRLRSAGRLVIGPSAWAAQLETSKAFAKNIMTKARVPTASYKIFDHPLPALGHLRKAEFPLVIKADGLAGGKGVTVCADVHEAHRVVVNLMVERVHGDAGARILIEEALGGAEISLLALVDGKRVIPMPLAKDHKRLRNGDEGPNTGGMGAYAPLPFLTVGQRDDLCRTILEPVVATMEDEGIPYRGVLFAGLMLTEDGPKVLEFNCRLGDPEAQVIIPLIRGDLLPWLEAVALEALPSATELPLNEGKAVGVVLASGGYPEKAETGKTIQGLVEASNELLIFHGATALDAQRRLVTAGGRVMTVVGYGKTLEEASTRAYDSGILFEGMQRRSDIARSGITKGQAKSAPLHKTPAPVGKRLKRIGVLASGGGSNLQAILDACHSGKIDGKVAVVVSHRAQAGALARARKALVPAAVVPLENPRDSAARREFEQRVLGVLALHHLDLIVLAGWMVILSAEFIARCGCSIINVHPALLPMTEAEELSVPALRGAQAVRDALDLQLPYTGASVHFVTSEVDAGPVLIRGMVPIEEKDNEECLHRRIKLIEHQLLPAAISLVLSNQQVSLEGSGSQVLEEKMEKSEEEIAVAGGVYA